MTTYKFGDIVLVGFPHTDLQGVSKRPAIVLHDSGDQDIFCKAHRVIFPESDILNVHLFDTSLSLTS